MTGLFLDLSDYYTDPIEEEFEVFLNESYYFIPSISNTKGWAKDINKKRGQRGASKILKRYVSPSGRKR
jgi:hypothetical protein